VASVPRKAQSSTSAVTTALTYTRVSSDEQARDGLSLDAQLTDCRRYAARNGWLLGSEYQDILTGKRDDRPDYQRILAAVRQLRADGTPVVVVVAALDRFGRRLLERVRSWEEIRSWGAAVHSVREGGEVSELTANILAAVAQEEVRRLGERVRASRDYIRDRGFKAPGHAAWGYRWRPATPEERAAGAPHSVLDLDEDVAPYVRELFQRIADGSSIRKGARWVQSLLAPVRQGRTLAQTAIVHLLRSPTYIARSTDTGGDPLDRPRMQWPPLIDDALWRRVQQQIEGHAFHHHQATGQYLLTGFLRCPRCSGRVAGAKTGPKNGSQRRYICTMEMNGKPGCNWTGKVEALDTPVLDMATRALAPFAATDRTFHAALDRAWRRLQQPDEAGEQREHRVAGLRRSSDRAKKRLADAATMFVDGAIDRAGYELVRDSAQAEIASVEEELARLQGAVSHPSLPSLDVVLAQVGEWNALLHDARTEMQREVLKVLLEQVEAEKVGHGQYGVRIRWTILGAALAEIAELAVSGPGDLHVGPPVRYARTLLVCAVCSSEYRGWSTSKVCGDECRRKARNARWRARHASGLTS
jgi:DNA invertase Pin-like site-specific DNA recombinase